MSSVGSADSYKPIKKPTHRRNDSGELDVFEAARYFSGAAETSCRTAMKEERLVWVAGRKSIDMPMRTSLTSLPHRHEKQSKEKKSKQPISPGGRLASFLNSLFSQSSSKKKSKSTTQSLKDEDESPGGRRKRRSSISHFRGLGNGDTKSLYSVSSSGFRTPPLNPHTPKKVYKDLRSCSSDHKELGSLPKCNGQARSVSFFLKNDILDGKSSMDLDCLDEKLKSNKDSLQKSNKFINEVLEEDRRNRNGYLKDKDSRRSVEVEDGWESDSSSDLFELQNFDLGVYSNGLPVYETTHMESIKRGTPIASGAF